MNIGMVLSGGMAKGAYQIGALRALNHFIPLEEMKYMSCASIGVLNGYAYARGSIDQAEQMWKNVCNNDTRTMVNRVLRSGFLQQSIGEITKPEKSLPFPFYCSLFDLNHRCIVYKDLFSEDASKIPLYLKASIAMPLYNRAVSLDNTKYFDGAMIDNIPVFPLLKQKLDYMICIYFDAASHKFENTYFDNKIIKITFPAEGLLKQSVILQRDSIEEMVKCGYDRTIELLESVFSKGYEDLDHIYHIIDQRNQNSKNERFRITGDVLVTNLNSITSKMAKRKIVS